MKLKLLFFLSLLITFSISKAAMPSYEVTISVIGDNDEIISRPTLIVKDGLKGSMFTGVLDSGTGHMIEVLAKRGKSGDIKIELMNDLFSQNKYELEMSENGTKEIRVKNLLNKKENRMKVEVRKI